MCTVGIITSDCRLGAVKATDALTFSDVVEIRV